MLSVVGKIFAAVMVVSVTVSVNQTTAHAAVNTSRFATHAEVAGSDGKKATITLPSGYPEGELTAVRDNSVSVPATPAFKNNTAEFQALFDPDDLNQNAPTHISLKSRGDGTPLVENSAEIIFPTPVPAGTLAMNLVDVDAEVVVIEMFNGATALSGSEINYKGSYNASTSAVENDPTWDATTTTLSGVGTDTTDQAAWFNPTQPVTRITLDFPDQQNMTALSVVYVWFAAIRPTPTLSATSVPSEYVIDDPDLELLDSQFTISFPEHFLTDAFDGDLGLTFSVSDQGGTGCALGTGPPVTLTATDPGTCELEAELPENTNKFFGASTTFSVAIVTEPTPAPQPTPSPTNATRPKPSAEPEPVVTESGPELAATGAPAAPLWAAGLLSSGVALVLWARLTQRSPVKASRLS